MSNGAFGPYAMNLFMEKLESEAESAKTDVYDFLIDCAKLYGAPCLQPFLPQLWTSIRIDLLKTSPNKLSDLAVQSLSVILITIESDKDIASNFVQDIIKDLEIPLTHLELILTKPASNCLAVISVVSPFYFEIVTESIFPLILQHWVFDEEKDNCEFIDEITTFFKVWSAKDFQLPAKKFSCQESIVLQLISSLNSAEDSTKLSCIECLSFLIQCSVNWNEYELRNIAKGILALCIGDELNAKLKYVLRKSYFLFLNELFCSTRLNHILVNFTRHHTDIANEEVLSHLIGKLSGMFF